MNHLFTLFTLVSALLFPGSDDRAAEDGFGTLELVLLICVLIGLALIFKGTIVDFVRGILNTISTQGSSFNPATLAG